MAATTAKTPQISSMTTLAYVSQFFGDDETDECSRFKLDLYKDGTLLDGYQRTLELGGFEDNSSQESLPISTPGLSYNSGAGSHFDSSMSDASSSSSSPYLSAVRYLRHFSNTGARSAYWGCTSHNSLPESASLSDEIEELTLEPELAT
jgi:hypothetical protein